MIRSRVIPTFLRCGEALLDVVFPRECPLTGAPPEPGSAYRFLSAQAIATLPLVDPPCCEICGAPFFGILAGVQVCPHCRELDPVFESGRTVMLARDAGRVLIHEFKYHGARHLAGDLAALACARPGYAERLRDCVLVPVPLHPKKLRSRGYNQSALLAQALAKRVPGAVVSELLIRVRDTPSQTHLDRKAREANTQKAFAIREGLSINPALRHVVVDDVFTTGSTLNACSETLVHAGVLRVSVATLGHG